MKRFIIRLTTILFYPLIIFLPCYAFSQAAYECHQMIKTPNLNFTTTTIAPCCSPGNCNGVTVYNECHVNEVTNRISCTIADDITICYPESVTYDRIWVSSSAVLLYAVNSETGRVNLLDEIGSNGAYFFVSPGLKSYLENLPTALSECPEPQPVSAPNLGGPQGECQ